MCINTWLTFFFNIYKSRYFHEQNDKQFDFHLKQGDDGGEEKTELTNIHITFMMQLLFRQQRALISLYIISVQISYC